MCCFLGITTCLGFFFGGTMLSGSLKEFTPSVLKENRTFLGSELNSGLLLSKSCHWLPSAGCAITSSSTLRSSSHHVMSAASLGCRKICLKRLVIGRYHITKAGIFLFFASLPNGVSSGGRVLGILNANRKIRKRTDTDVAFTREYSRGSIFHRERECTN